MNKCLECEKPTKTKFCSRSCSTTHNNHKYPKRHQDGKCKGCGVSIVSQRTYCDSCWQAKKSTFRKPGQKRIRGRIDGNSSNWSINNRRLVCSNCDSQLPTHKARNHHKGRPR